LAEQKEGNWSSTQAMSKKLRIPRIFLAKIVNALARHKIVETQRGKSGGLRLLKKDVTVSEIIRLLDPKFSLNKCLGKSYTCFMEKSCPLHKLLKLIEKELFQKLDSTAITQLV
jgi:Rrf2 family nitric oxide-sensitive transcriptional repressor